jgi:hypothetical protein
VAEVLLKHGAKINLADTVGRTPLIHAMEQGHTKMMQFLLEKGADPNAMESGYGSAVTYAISRTNIEALRILLQHGGDLRPPIIAHPKSAVAEEYRKGLAYPQIQEVINHELRPKLVEAILANTNLSRDPTNVVADFLYPRALYSAEKETLEAQLKDAIEFLPPPAAPEEHKG